MNDFKLRSLLLPLTTALFFISACIPAFASTQEIKLASVQKKLEALEASSGGRLGISAIDTANNTHIQYRADERFPFCSTSKVMVVSAILKQSIADSHLLQQKITYTEKDVDSSGYAPITKTHVVSGMTIGELCAAAIDYSDNAALNLLLKTVGGPTAVNSFARSIGDNTFRLDRWEPKLNSAIPGDLRDTSTPAAMASSLQQLALGNILELPQRTQLQTWMKNNTTGNARIRAGAPKGWLVGDKTGTGDYGTTNDIAVIWPPNSPLIVVVIYFTQNKKDAAPRDDVIAAATSILINTFAQTFN
jgi:beta-lactamase class A